MLLSLVDRLTNVVFRDRSRDVSESREGKSVLHGKHVALLEEDSRYILKREGVSVVEDHDRSACRNFVFVSTTEERAEQLIVSFSR